MNLRFDADDERFRAEVREFVCANLPSDMAWRTRHGSYLGHYEDSVAWSAILHRKGWSAPHWPVEHGGTGWTAMQQHLFHEECARADAPHLPTAGVYLVGPVIIAVGSEAQKNRFLSGIRAGTETWCQGFSEPNAGSDLASLRTRAVRNGDHYVVSGQKMWTGGGHVADWGFFLVRTDSQAKPQAGISFLLVDMKSPGVTVRPIVTLDGEHHTNEVFLDDVTVPAENLVGDENKGWTYAKFLLGNERTMSAEIYWSKRELEKLKQMAGAERASGRPIAEDPAFRQKLACLEIDLLALEYSVLRVLAKEETKFQPPAVTSALKIRGSELMQRVTELQAETFGLKALRFFKVTEFDSDAAFPRDSAWPTYGIGKTGGALTLRASTIFGGTKEIQKNIIARAFGL